jgi:hypothetical protein
MKMEISCNERWPVFVLSDAKDTGSQDFTVDLTDSLIEDFIQIQEQYDKMQKTLRGMYDRCEQNREKKFSSTQEELWAYMLKIVKSVYGAP